MPYEQKFALLRSQVMRDKIGMALLKAATALKDTPAPDPKPDNWDAKQAWARDVISPNCLRWIDVAIFFVLTNEQITNAGEAALDSDVQWMVEHVIDDLAKVTLR